MATRNRESIVRAVALRVLVYALLALIVAFSQVDFGSLRARRVPAVSLASGDAVALGPGWPHLRGPDYDAHSKETGMADAWPAGGPPVLWTRDIGAGFSGLIAHGGRVYTQAQGLAEQKVFAFDADTGQTVWEHGYSWPYQAGGMFPGPRATPTWSDGRIYFASPNGLVGCLDATDGHPLWSVNVVERFEGRGAGFGYACSPVVEDGMVILPVGGPSASVVALDALTGATRWASGGAPASYCSALPITFRGRHQVAVFLQNALAGFDLQTGRPLWEQTYPRGFEEHAAALLYHEPYLRATQAYRAGSDLYELEAGSPADENGGVPGCTIKRVRHDASMSNDIASSVLVDGNVYGFDLREMQAAGGRPSRGTFRCVDFMTGRVRWSSDKPGQAGIVVADGKLLMLNDSGQAVLVRANPDRYEELGREDVFPGETCWTAPALDGGRLYLRSPTRAACLFVGKPGRMTPRQRALASRAPSDLRAARTDLTWLVGAEREYPFEMPDPRELARWYLFSLSAWGAAGLLAGVAHLAVRFGRGGPLRLVPEIVFWCGLLVFGIVATPLANRYWGAFVFTWPLSLVAAHQIALAAVSWSRQPGRNKTADWVGIAGALLLVLICVLYFKLTRQLHLAPAWYFLALLPAAWPLAIPAARRLCRPGGLLRDILWMLAVFSACFWAAGGVMLLRTEIHYRA
jgi:outer membrane protein assembly factor BamB